MPRTTPTQQANSLIDLYVKTYEELHGSRPTDLNRNSAGYGFRNMVTDLGVARATQVIAQFFQVRKYHNINDLTYHYHEIDQAMTEERLDHERRMILREATRKMVQGE